MKPCCGVSDDICNDPYRGWTTQMITHRRYNGYKNSGGNKLYREKNMEFINLRFASGLIAHIWMRFGSELFFFIDRRATVNNNKLFSTSFSFRSEHTLETDCWDWPRKTMYSTPKIFCGEGHHWANHRTTMNLGRWFINETRRFES